MSLNHSDEIALGFDWTVADLLTKGSDEYQTDLWRKNLDDEFQGSGSRQREYNTNETIIDWTPEREKWFLDLEQMFVEMAKRMNDFLSQDQAAILKAMESL